MRTPNIGNTYRGGPWAADSGCFNAATYKGDDAYKEWLIDNQEHQDKCLFATAPDVMGDHAATVVRAHEWLPLIRELGYAPAFVLQDGATVDSIPWDELDWVFIGGTTDFKLSDAAQTITAHAKSLGKKVHMGRVNSRKRFRLAAAWGCDSVDGTYLAFGPDVNLPKLLSWIEEQETQGALF
jgi:hypothetical protein